MKHKKFSVTIIFICLETVEVSINRIKERVLKGGHSVRESDVVRRYYRSKKNFWNVYKDIVDSWHLIYNSGPNFNVIAVGEGDGFIINDDEIFQQFLRDIKEVEIWKN